MPVVSIVLFSVALLGVLYIAVVYLGRLSMVRRRCRECDAAMASSQHTRLPKASVVVCTRNEGGMLAQNLPAILAQQYPGEFEVVVVNDGTPDETDDVVTRLKNQYSNLYLTFVPDSTRNISRKKLAIQLGIKAAKGEVVVITDATAKVPSEQWLAEMVAPFADRGVEVVLGYNYIDLPDSPFAGRMLTAFDCAADASTWLSAAIAGHSYAGCGNNIAYRKELYFRNNGFHSSFNLRYGDDDLFVNEIASGRNTVVQLSSASRGIFGVESSPRKHYYRHRLRHAFTGRTLPKTSRRIMAIGEWMMWVVTVCALAGAVFAGIDNFIGWGIAAALIISILVMVILGWRSTVAALGGPSMLLSIPWMAATRPLRNMMTAFAARPSKNAWYTWQ